MLLSILLVNVTSEEILSSSSSRYFALSWLGLRDCTSNLDDVCCWKKGASNLLRLLLNLIASEFGMEDLDVNATVPSALNISPEFNEDENSRFLPSPWKFELNAALLTVFPWSKFVLPLTNPRWLDWCKLLLESNDWTEPGIFTNSSLEPRFSLLILIGRLMTAVRSKLPVRNRLLLLIKFRSSEFWKFALAILDLPPPSVAPVLKPPKLPAFPLPRIFPLWSPTDWKLDCWPVGFPLLSIRPRRLSYIKKKTVRKSKSCYD